MIGTSKIPYCVKGNGNYKMYVITDLVINKLKVSIPFFFFPKDWHQENGRFRKNELFRIYISFTEMEGRWSQIKKDLKGQAKTFWVYLAR